MLHHLSVAVDHPLHVAQVVAEILQGRVFPFPPFPGSYIVVAGDDYGTAIEIAPAGTELIPGDTAAVAHQNASAARFTVTHAAFSVPTSREEIEQIAAREGWLVRYCNREGVFDVIELWVENRLLLEFMTPEMVPQYTQFMTLENCALLLDPVLA